MPFCILKSFSPQRQALYVLPGMTQKALCRAYLVVNAEELPGPPRIVQKGPQVKPVVVRTVVFSVICWREGRHLVSVHGVL